MATKVNEKQNLIAAAKQAMRSASTFAELKAANLLLADACLDLEKETRDPKKVLSRIRRLRQ